MCYQNLITTLITSIVSTPWVRRGGEGGHTICLKTPNQPVSGRTSF